MKIVSLIIGGVAGSYLAIHFGWLVSMAMIALCASGLLWHDAFKHQDKE